MELFGETSTWFLFSFIVFAFIVWRFSKDKVLGMLDRRIENIREEINMAENLRVEAQELLAQYERKHRDGIKDAENIIANAQSHVAEIRKQADADLKEIMERREKQLKERLELMEKSATAEIQKYAADLAIKATTEIIAKQLDKKSNSNLVDQAIKGMKTNIA